MPSRRDTLFLPQLPDDLPHQSRRMPWQRWGEGGGMQFTLKALQSRDHLVLADNLSLLEILPPGLVDLVYIDPPFATGKRRESPRGGDGPEGYEDNWESPEAFIEWLAPRLQGIWRILADNGNLVIHLDTRAVHLARVWCDREFGSEHWENEIIWHYTGGGRSRKRFSRKHDVLLWYSKGSKRVFNIDAIREPYKPTSGYAKGGIVSKKGKKYMPHPDGKPADDVWDIPIVNPLSRERSDYPTQKPIRLLERIVGALSDEDALVGDFFCGSGTTALASRALNRRFICCDSNPDAIGVTLDRLKEQNPDLKAPALLSQGFYRIGFAEPDCADGLAGLLMEKGLRLDREAVSGILYPAWRKDSEPFDPLDNRDAIVAVRY